MKVREPRKFSIDVKSEKRKKKEEQKKCPPRNLYDTLPDEDESCNKEFPFVSKQGYSYLFLWHCPLHQHCLGFHIIPGQEGRKDPHASLYCYSVEQISVVIYDFICSFSEYCKNRESGFFANTRMYHDEFHGVNHKCSDAFKHKRLPEHKALNSSLMEQFNGWIKNLEESAMQMTQNHFTFILQFFMHRWNRMKYQQHLKKETISRAALV